MTQSLFALLARISLGVIFLFVGWNQVLESSRTIQWMSQAGIPLAKWLYGLAVVLELLGGILLVLGARTRSAAFLLALFLIPATYFFHYDFSDRGQVVHVLKNLAIFGGLLQLAAFGGGRFSLDRN